MCQNITSNPVVFLTITSNHFGYFYEDYLEKLTNIGIFEIFLRFGIRPMFLYLINLHRCGDCGVCREFATNRLADYCMERGNLVVCLACLAPVSSSALQPLLWPVCGCRQAAHTTQPVCELELGPARLAVRDQPVSECGPMLELGHPS